LHAAPTGKDVADALSHQDSALVVFEFGKVSPTLQTNALRRLPGDIDMAASTWPPSTIGVRKPDNARGVPSRCRVSGKPPQLQRDIS
jgi:hypothetical protein